MDMHGQIHTAKDPEHLGRLCSAIVQDPTLPPIERPTQAQLAAGSIAIRASDRILGSAASFLAPLVNPIVDKVAKRVTRPKSTPRRRTSEANKRHAIRANSIDRRRILANRGAK